LPTPTLRGAYGLGILVRYLSIEGADTGTGT